MPAGIPLFLTVTATNSAKESANAVCELVTYDTSLPGGRVTPDYISTSHPSYILGSGVALDDSKITSEMVAVGLSPDTYGNQLSYWDEVDLDENTESVSVDDDPFGAQVLEHFAKERQGRVDSQPHLVDYYDYPQLCAEECLKYSETKCLSFNYDYGDSGKCELLEEIEGHGVKLHQEGSFFNFERIGIGHTAKFIYSDLQLEHNQLYYINFYLQNELNYLVVLSSEGILADFTPPDPGLIQNAEYDKVTHESCVDFTELWSDRCIQETTLDNHREILDGPGSETVFNGHEPKVDNCYTRANKYVSANWDGFHDDQTGIYGYLVSVGTDPCQNNIHPHHDPHAHLFSEDEWTHIMVASGLNLTDGLYHVSTRAINKIEFGGPMSTTVCHTKEYVIDNTPPLVHYVSVLEYDEDLCLITVEYNTSDPLSNIREVDFGMGLSKRDTYLLSWQRYPNLTSLTHEICIADGVRAYTLIRSINNVDLREIGAAPDPIIIDTSPPIAGEVLDGSEHGKDVNFTSDGSSICANWRNFYDEESGIKSYLWGVGTEPYGEDVVSFILLASTVQTYCASVELVHNTIYYSTVIAFNGGLTVRNISETSNGVLYDATPPLEGWAHDGLDSDNDLVYSSEPSTISAIWGDYSDPESAIKEYLVSIYRQPSANSDNNSTDAELIHEMESVDPSYTYINWHHFHLHHGDFVFTKLQAVNRALSQTATVTSGFTLDLTSPLLLYLGDGDVSGKDNKYSFSLSQLSANWNFEDLESGLERFEVAIYQTSGGTRQQIYPDNGWAILENSVTVWTTPDTLSLREGAFYSIRVSAINGAGLSSVYDTDGVIIDSTDPEMLKVRVGVTADMSEELFDGFVVQSDKAGILATWLGVDEQSGIQAYWVSVGTSPGGEDIKAFTSMGILTDTYIDGLQLELYDEGAQQPVYYVTVKAENGAGLFSPLLSSSPIKVLPGDKPGIVYDGAIPQADVDYQSDTATVTFNFQGFESQTSGLAHFQWAVGTEPGNDDVQPYTSLGIILASDPEEELGLSGNGTAQAALELEGGHQYFVTARAETGAGGILDAHSNGFIVDITPPVVKLESLGVSTDETNSLSALGIESVYYQKSVDWLTAEWSITEIESEVALTAYWVGSYPGASDVFPATESTDDTSIPIGLVAPLQAGKPNFVTVFSENNIGFHEIATSSSLLVDDTAPIEGSVTCPEYIASGDFACSWTGFYDEESTIINYQIGLGLQEGDYSVMNLTELTSETTLFTFKETLIGELSHNVKYFVTVVAHNQVELSSNAYSSAISVDATPPSVGAIFELSGVKELDLISSQNDSFFQTLCGANEAIESCDWSDAVCQVSLTRIIAVWQHFEDDESPLVKYEVSLGTTSGGGQIKSFTELPAIQNYTLMDDVDLSQVEQVFVTVRGTNAAGLVATVTSNGVYISRIASGLQPLGDTYVWDGDSDGDLDYQDNNEALYAQWDFSGDPCPIDVYRWSIFRTDGEVVLPLTEVPQGIEYGELEGVQLNNGESYFVTVQATNVLGYTYTLHSDGITIQTEPLTPGNVRDGAVLGFDLAKQDSITTLSANWDGFGQDADEAEPEPQQQVAYYEVAIGTDRRFPSTRTNVHPFYNVGKNQTWTFKNLILIPMDVTYYVTVRAHSQSTSTADVTSNGIQVGFDGGVTVPGTITASRYIASTDTLKISWDGFEFGLPILFYQWAILSASSSGQLQDVDCSQLKIFSDSGEIQTNPDYESLFDVYPLTNVVLDSLVEPTGLNLENGATYTIVVIATSESSQCVLIDAEFTVDLSPPSNGSLQIGPYENAPIMYSSKSDELQVTWKGFSDEDSGLESIEVALYQGDACSGANKDTLKTLVEPITLPGNETTYDFKGILLLPETAYYVYVCAINRAGLSSCIVSPPVFVDLVDPVAGTIRDGLNVFKERQYQNYTDRIEGVFLYLPDPDLEKCPERLYELDTKVTDESWSFISQESIVGLENGRRIIFEEEQLTFDSENGLSITMIRDIQRERMLSGAYAYKNPEILEGGSVKIDIKAGGDDINAVTSFTLWDGPESVVGTFENNPPVEESSSGECQCCLYVTLAPPTTESNLTRPSTTADATTMAAPMASGTSNTSSSAAAPTGPTTTIDPLACTCDCVEYWKNASAGLTTARTVTPAVTTERPPWQVMGEEVVVDIVADDYTMQPAVGFQLFSGMVSGEEVKNFALLWGSFVNNSYDPKYYFVELDFDPSEAWHTYELLISVDDTYQTAKEWMVELSADGRKLALISGLPAQSSLAKVVMSVWNLNDYVPGYDLFSPPSTVASFRNLRLPPPPETACRYLDPFRSGDNPIVSFLAGIGSRPEADDIAPLREVIKPCIPCTSVCGELNCDQNCTSSAVHTYTAALTGLQLLPNYYDSSENETLNSVYHLVIVAMTGSGRSVTASSPGVFIDITPPIFKKFHHVDYAYSLSEPAEYQKSNSTISVYWEAYDLESPIEDFLWAIGTEHGGTDIQDFVSVGATTKTATNANLEGVLRDKQTYYVSIRSKNAAGLETTIVTPGVTVLLTLPDISNSSTELPCKSGSSPALSKLSLLDTNLCADQDKLGVAWGALDDKAITSYSVSIGSDLTSDDIFPLTVFGYNESGILEIENGKIYLGGEPLYNVSDVQVSEDEKDSSRFEMEPGKTIYVRIVACNAAHSCNDLKVEKRIIFRNGDAAEMSENGTDASVSLSSNDDASGRFSMNVTALTGVEGHGLIAGIFSKEDVEKEYTSSASSSYSSYVVNPKTTTDQTDRYLENRNMEPVDINGYLKEISTDGELQSFDLLEISLSSEALCSNSSNKVAKFLLWDKANTVWIDAARTCSLAEDYFENYDPENCTIQLKICSFTQSTSSGGSRKRRAVKDEEGAITDTVEFSLALLDDEFSNTAPEITSELELWMDEDSGTLVYQLEATDADDDDLAFHLNDSMPLPTGEVTLTTDGELTYTPCADCAATVQIHFYAIEVREEYSLLYANAVLLVDVREVNDYPEAAYFGSSLATDIDAESGEHRVIIEQRNLANPRTANSSLVAVFGGYDVDVGDVLQVLLDQPAHGSLEDLQQSQAVELLEIDCSSSDQLAIFGEGGSIPDKVYLPCDTELPHSSSQLSLFAASTRFVPSEGFYGTESLKAVLQDGGGYNSRLMTLTVYVLANPCENGQCVGPQGDEDCTSLDRAAGFQGYSCNCSVGYVGDFCETNFDECASSPCPFNYTCTDQVNGYECSCENPDTCILPAANGWQPWVIGVSVVIACLLLVVGFFVVRRFMKRSEKSRALAESDNSAELKGYRNMESGLYTPDEKDGLTNPAMVESTFQDDMDNLETQSLASVDLPQGLNFDSEDNRDSETPPISKEAWTEKIDNEDRQSGRNSLSLPMMILRRSPVVTPLATPTGTPASERRDGISQRSLNQLSLSIENIDNQSGDLSSENNEDEDENGDSATPWKKKSASRNSKQAGNDEEDTSVYLKKAPKRFDTKMEESQFKLQQRVKKWKNQKKDNTGT